VLHLHVDERLDLGEVDDVVEDAGDVGAREPEDRSVQVDVLAAGQLGVEPGAELEQGGDPAVADDRPVRGAQDPGDALQQGRLPRPVGTEEADGLAGRDLQVDVALGPETPRARCARCGSPAP